MEYKKFEQHIANTLRSEEVALDIQGLIDDIHGKKKKRRAGFIWLWAALGMVLLGSGTILVSKVINKGIQSESPSAKLMLNNTATNMSEVKQENNSGNNTLENGTILNNNHIPTKENKKVSSEWMVTDSDHISVDKDMASTSVLDENMAVEKLESSMNIHENNLSEMAQRKINLTAALENKNILSIQAIENKPPFIGRDKIVCPTFSNNGKLYLEIIPELGAFLPIKKLENSSAEPNNVFSKRNTDEKSLEGLNAGLYMRLSKEKSPFYIKAGLSWSRLSEKMPLTYSYTRKDTTQGIISVTVSQTGDTITYIYGDIIQERKISGNKTKHYSISMLDLPVAVGAEKRFGSWFAGIEAGLYLNLSMKSTGNLLASDTSFVSIDTPVEYFKRSIGLSYFGGIHIGKEFNHAGRIFLAARARFIPESFSTDQNRIRQTYHFIGLNLGYVYTF
jgi:hypothetical protein